MRTRRRHIVSSAAVVTVAAVVLAPVAAAHIEPDPSTVKPGKVASVAFNVEHGCGDSPTTKLEFQIPKKAKHVKAEPKAGWTTKVTSTTVAFEGGPLDAHTEDTFSITFTAPRKKTVLTWKVVQTCVQGVTRWIDTSKDAEDPAPKVGVGKKVVLPD
jgi:periplasmic copper chaperone A